VRTLLRRLADGLTTPLRRYFNPRFESLQSDLHGALDELAIARKEIVRAEHELMVRADRLKDLVVHNMDLSTDQARIMGTYLSDILAATETLAAERLVGGRVEHVDGALAALLNYAGSPTGFAAQRDLYFNPPVWVRYEAGDVVLGGVNERIAEIPYVFAALSEVPRGGRILDVGSGESSVALSLATLGYQVTALDPRGYPFEHPNLQTVTTSVEAWQTDDRFDAVVCLSTVEHIGLGAYGVEGAEPDGDLRAMRRIFELTKPGGLLVCTTPYGEPSVDDFQRVYDDAGLARLIDGWEITDRLVVRRRDDVTWELADGAEGAPAAVLVTARRPS
jgi:SAM-dependent methyltransferase